MSDQTVPLPKWFWQKDILFELCLFWYLAQGQILGMTLYDKIISERKKINIFLHRVNAKAKWSTHFLPMCPAVMNCAPEINGLLLGINPVIGILMAMVDVFYTQLVIHRINLCQDSNHAVYTAKKLKIKQMVAGVVIKNTLNFWATLGLNTFSKAYLNL